MHTQLNSSGALLHVCLFVLRTARPAGELYDTTRLLHSSLRLLLE
jgi:hypothetical protein